jgi:chlorobactene glucosyltransferase
VAAILPALPWLLLTLALIRLGRKRPKLNSSAPATGPRVSVIIPARNEEGSIASVIRSVLASTYPDFELLVVDDRSTDGTAAQVTSLAAADSRLRLIAGAELPPGWYGKPWACHQGYQAATGEVLVFTDADTRHQPALLGHAVGALEQESADLVTIAPRQRCVSFWERVIMPQIWVLLGLRFHPDTVNHARRERDVIANGQFVCVRRASYEAVGTHAAVRGEVAEDLALAQAFWRSGRKVYFAFAETLMETRMYTGLSHLIEGWTKNLFLGSRRSFPDSPFLRATTPLVLSAAMLIWLVPVIIVTLASTGILAGPPDAFVRQAVWASLVFWTLISIGMQIPPWYGLLYPLGAAVSLYIIMLSTIRGRARVEWRGRTYGVEINSAS